MHSYLQGDLVKAGGYCDVKMLPSGKFRLQQKACSIEPDQMAIYAPTLIHCFLKIIQTGNTRVNTKQK